MLKKDCLKGSIVYYDGQHNDARMCLSIGLTGEYSLDCWFVDNNLCLNELLID